MILSRRTQPSLGPFVIGQTACWWKKDLSKIRGGLWVKARVTHADKPPMVTISVKDTGEVKNINKSLLKVCPDHRHDVVIPGLDEEAIKEGDTQLTKSYTFRRSPSLWSYGNESERPLHLWQL